ncbi:hypothetical protein Q9233_009671 [Columba guinea]|nr:hypothetical protein Q9233_009671 [Columba guinea]
MDLLATLSGTFPAVISLAEITVGQKVKQGFQPQHHRYNCRCCLYERVERHHPVNRLEQQVTCLEIASRTVLPWLKAAHSSLNSELGSRMRVRPEVHQPFRCLWPGVDVHGACMKKAGCYQLSCQTIALQSFGGPLLNGLLQPLNFSIDPVPCIVRTF